MKTICLTIILFFWMVFTIILACSIVGLLVISPQMNDTAYYKPPEQLRSTWMRIGYSLKDELIES